MMDIGYVGWVGHNNLGDEGIYTAVARATNEIRIKPSAHAPQANVTLLGGGTILPFAYADASAYQPRTSLINAALGVGVGEPEFENRRRGPVDIRWLAGQAGINTNEVLSGMGPIGSAIDQIGAFVPGITLTGVYCHDADFRRTGAALDLITVRGPRSKEILNGYDIDSRVVGDTALLLEPPEYYPDASGKVTITLRTPGTDRKWSHSDDYISEIMAFCRSLSDSVEIVFLPFHPVDIPLHSRLARALSNARWVDYCSVVNIDGVLHEMATANVVIGEKLHANVFAACCYTPFVSLEYNPKAADFAASLGMSELNSRIDSLDESTLDNLYNIAHAYDSNDIKTVVDGYRDKLTNTIDDIVARGHTEAERTTKSA